MGKRGANSAISYRNAEAMATAVMVIGLLAWTVLEFSGQPEFIGRENVRGIVTEIEERSRDGLEQTESNSKFQSIEVELPEGDVISLRLNVSGRGPFKVGDPIPMLEEQFDDGSKNYLFDQQTWDFQTYQ